MDKKYQKHVCKRLVNGESTICYNFNNYSKWCCVCNKGLLHNFKQILKERIGLNEELAGVIFHELEKPDFGYDKTYAFYSLRI